MEEPQTASCFTLIGAQCGCTQFDEMFVLMVDISILSSSKSLNQSEMM